ncbi:MAG: S1C family serine protease [Candidatus Omnitrophota bacterium]
MLWLAFIFFIQIPNVVLCQEHNLLQSSLNLQPSIVTIKAFNIKTSNKANSKIKISGIEHQGNGVIIDSSGIIVTNNHIIDGAKYIIVTLSDGSVSNASVLYTGQTDFCFLKISTSRPLKAIAQANFSQIKNGDHIIALLEHQPLLSGTIAHLINEDEDTTSIAFLELNLDLHPGDSGGAIFSEQGCLLGLIMAQKKSDTQKSYAISFQKIWKEYQRFNGSVLINTDQ